MTPSTLLTTLTSNYDQIIRSANPSIWMDATRSDLLTLNGDLVVNQVSRVNGLQATQATASNQPKLLSSGINGRPALSFYHSGAASSLVMNDHPLMDWSEMFQLVVFERTVDTGVTDSVVSKLSPTGNQREWSITISSINDRVGALYAPIGTGAGAVSAVPSYTPSLNQPTIFAVWYQASDKKLYARTITATQDVAMSGAVLDPVFNGTSPISYGTKAGGLTEPYMGKKGEHVLCNYLPSASLREVIFGAVRKKWGI